MYLAMLSSSLVSRPITRMCSSLLPIKSDQHQRLKPNLLTVVLLVQTLTRKSALKVETPKLRSKDSQLREA